MNKPIVAHSFEEMNKLDTELVNDIPLEKRKAAWKAITELLMNLSFRARINALAVQGIFIAAFLIGLIHEVKSQTASDTLSLDQPILVQDQPEYPGGYEKMMIFLRKKMTYPKAAVRQRIEGTVYVAFVLDEEGRVKDVRTLRGISTECDAEAERVVRLMPKWKPGKLDGKPVPVRFVLPIMFKGRAKWTKGS